MDKVAWGKLMVHLRECRGFNQKQMAEWLNVSASTLCKWEAGTNCPDSIKEQRRLAEKCDIAFEELINPIEALQKVQKGIKLKPFKKNNARMKEVILCVAALVVIFACVLAVVHFSQPKFRVVDTRYNEEGAYGTAYEMAIVCRGGIGRHECEKYADTVYSEWKNEKLSVDAVTVDMYFYTNKEDALNWEISELNVSVILRKEERQCLEE